MHKILVRAQDSCACTRFWCMHKILVPAQVSCACTRILCMHKILVHAHDTCAGTRILCMHQNLVHAQESCARTRILCMHKCCLNYSVNRIQDDVRLVRIHACCCVEAEGRGIKGCVRVCACARARVEGWAGARAGGWRTLTPESYYQMINFVRGHLRI